jgi:hypothetical protein
MAVVFNHTIIRACRYSLPRSPQGKMFGARIVSVRRKCFHRMKTWMARTVRFLRKQRERRWNACCVNDAHANSLTVPGTRHCHNRAGL